MRHSRWEYKTMLIDVGGLIGPKVKPELLDGELNMYGDAGWELVSALDINRTHGKTTAIVALFKRPRN